MARLGSCRALCMASGVLLIAGILVGCTESGSATSINVLMVNNSQMIDLQRLTADNFTKQTGITVNFTVLPEDDVRDKVSQDFSAQAGKYDVASISNYEVPIYAKSGWLEPLGDFIAADPSFDQNDIEQSMRQSLTASDGKVYAEPFYGESSFLMYRRDVFQAKGLTMPVAPTWQQIADLAAEADGAQPGMRGICLRGKPGWGELTAPLTTVVNTFGGTWFTKNWQAQVDSPAFRQATEFYVDLVRAHGEGDAAAVGFAECLTDMEQGKVAMWYDATSAAGLLEANGSPVALKIGYAPAPVAKTDVSSWLYTWAWGMQTASKNRSAAWKFISWASSKDYERLVGEKLGWARIPAGKRASTKQYAGYLQATGAFALVADNAITDVDPRNPGTQPRPTIGVQFVDIPEFAGLGDQVSQQISSAIAGSTSVDAALADGQKLAAKVATKYQGK